MLHHITEYEFFLMNSILAMEFSFGSLIGIIIRIDPITIPFWGLLVRSNHHSVIADRSGDRNKEFALSNPGKTEYNLSP
jgi:hypothetical protein